MEMPRLEVASEPHRGVLRRALLSGPTPGRFALVLVFALMLVAGVSPTFLEFVSTMADPREGRPWA